MRFQNSKTSKFCQTTGFTMLFAVLVSSVLLAVGVSIFNITIKELKISSAIRESQIAINAADAGRDCALYWDFNGSKNFATSTVAKSALNSNAIKNASDIICGNLISDLAIPSVAPITTSFKIQLGSVPASSNCVTVSVEKTYDSVGDYYDTRIQSRGYNNSCDSLTDPSTVERGIEVEY